MSLPILTVRPEPGATATVTAGCVLNLAIESAPLFAIRPVAWSAPDPNEIDALLVGSANALRHGGKSLAAFRGKPLYAVGEATSEVARDAGFKVAATGTGGLQGVVDDIAAPLRLLRLAGEERVPLTSPDGVEIETRVAYRAEPLPLPGAAATRLRTGAIVLLHSAAAARHFSEELDRLALYRSVIRLAVLGPRIAAAAGSGWASVSIAAQPTEAALLALAGELCHDRETSRPRGDRAGSEER